MSCPSGYREEFLLSNGRPVVRCVALPGSEDTNTGVDIEQRILEIAAQIAQEKAAAIGVQVQAKKAQQTPISSGSYQVKNPTIPKVILLGTGFILMLFVALNMKG